MQPVGLLGENGVEALVVGASAAGLLNASISRASRCSLPISISILTSSQPWGVFLGKNYRCSIPGNFAPATALATTRSLSDNGLAGQRRKVL